MRWPLAEADRVRVLWRLHLLLVAVRSDARRQRDPGPALTCIIQAVDALQLGGADRFEEALAGSDWAGAKWKGSPHPGPTVARPVVAGCFVEALAIGCAAALDATPIEVEEFADSMEYIPATLCRGDDSVLYGLDGPGNSRLVRVVGSVLRSRGIT
jgi:hypothetical protein